MHDLLKRKTENGKPESVCSIPKQIKGFGKHIVIIIVRDKAHPKEGVSEESFLLDVIICFSTYLFTGVFVYNHRKNGFKIWVKSNHFQVG